MVFSRIVSLSLRSRTPAILLLQADRQRPSTKTSFSKAKAVHPASTAHTGTIFWSAAQLTPLSLRPRPTQTGQTHSDP